MQLVFLHNITEIREQCIKKMNFFENFPVLERVLERVLRDGAKVPHRIFFYLLYRLKSATF